MERRDFLKISAVAGATAALDGCGNPDHQLIRFLPEEDLIPGMATWKPSICTLCPAGCGLLVRVMAGEAEVIRNGQLGLLQMNLAKKLEGNPLHPINQGKLCPRGQSGLQVTYHPDRVKSPLVRNGRRGSGLFREVSWDDAMKQLLSQLSGLQGNNQEGGLAFVTAPLRGQRRMILDSFVASFKHARPIEFAFFDDSVMRLANSASFGYALPPTVDIGQSNYVISLGADFLGTWNSPVAQSVGFGNMRKGRPGQRGKFVQFEPRISQTGASADEWIPVRPGFEGRLALSLAHVLIAEKLRVPAAAGRAGSLIEGWPQGLPDYAPEKMAEQVGVKGDTIARIAREAAAHDPAVAMIGDAALAHTNGLFNAIAVNALNALLGSVGRQGGILFSPVPSPKQPAASFATWVSQISSGAAAVRVLLLYNANPVFATPIAWGVREALDKIPFIASFGSFIDETSALADLILPDHSPLESWLEDIPVAGSAKSVFSLAPPAMNPLHNSRSTPDVLLDVAHQLGGDVAKALPWKSYEEAIRDSFAVLYKQKANKAAKNVDEFWQQAQKQGGWWSNEESKGSPSSGASAGTAKKSSVPQFYGDLSQYPFFFLPFASQLFYDGSLANLPWMQEAPDPLSTVMWGTWVEINPSTAGKLAIQQGNLVEVASPYGTLRAPALLTPGIAPDVIAMPIGQGHENFTRYATGRGSNPLSILSPAGVEGTGSLAWAATRVKVSLVGRGTLILFGGSLRASSPELTRR